VKQEKINRIMAQVKAFPGMPDTSAKLMTMLKDSESSAAQIESVLKYDPGLTANILKLTNSAYFCLFWNPFQGQFRETGRCSVGVETFAPTGDDHVHEYGHEKIGTRV